MKLFIMILFLPLMISANILGAISALFIVGATNGYATVMEILEKAQE